MDDSQVPDYQIPDYETFTETNGYLYRKDVYYWLISNFALEINESGMVIESNEDLLFELRKDYLNDCYISELTDLLIAGHEGVQRTELPQEALVKEVFDELNAFRDELMRVFPDILVPGNKTKSANKR